LTALQGRRLPVEAFIAKGYGEDGPIADNATEEGREANRRIEFLPRPLRATDSPAGGQTAKTTAEGAAEDAAPQVGAQDSQTAGMNKSLGPDESVGQDESLGQDENAGQRASAGESDALQIGTADQTGPDAGPQATVISTQGPVLAQDDVDQPIGATRSITLPPGEEDLIFEPSSEKFDRPRHRP
ncbi:MAG: hypothetical protein U1D06_07250, partial [Paracoccaceae bacterium]|nr:hypothetical protein [Paracoccaceae bacterium]